MSRKGSTERTSFADTIRFLLMAELFNWVDSSLWLSQSNKKCSTMPSHLQTSQRPVGWRPILCKYLFSLQLWRRNLVMINLLVVTYRRLTHKPWCNRRGWCLKDTAVSYKAQATSVRISMIMTCIWLDNCMPTIQLISLLL